MANVQLAMPHETAHDSKPQGVIKNAAYGDRQRRTRKCPTPHAEMPNAARGDCHRRTRRF